MSLYSLRKIDFDFFEAATIDRNQVLLEVDNVSVPWESNMVFDRAVTVRLIIRFKAIHEWLP